VAILPEILKRLCHSGSDPTLDLVGDGPELSAIRRLANHHKVLGRINFLGQVPHSEVPRITGDADICLDVAPGTPLNHQSTMVKIGEYMAAGRPIVTFALHETRCTAGDCALYVPCDDMDDFCAAILRLCEDEEERATLSAQALARAREMTWEHSADCLRHAYALATAKGPGLDRDEPRMFPTSTWWLRWLSPGQRRRRRSPAARARRRLRVGARR
jgi:glycosyltransferase involved in cell wall biosynthesis